MISFHSVSYFSEYSIFFHPKEFCLVVLNLFQFHRDLCISCRISNTRLLCTPRHRTILRPRHIQTSVFLNLLTYSMEKVTGFEIVKKFPEFYGTQTFFTAFASACNLSLS